MLHNWLSKKRPANALADLNLRRRYMFKSMCSDVAAHIICFDSSRLDGMSLAWPAVVQLLVFIYSGIQ